MRAGDVLIQRGTNRGIAEYDGCLDLSFCFKILRNSFFCCLFIFASCFGEMSPLFLAINFFSDSAITVFTSITDKKRRKNFFFLNQLTPWVYNGNNNVSSCCLVPCIIALHLPVQRVACKLAMSTGKSISHSLPTFTSIISVWWCRGRPCASCDTQTL